MPLCTLEIPRARYEALAAENRDEEIVAIANDVLERTLRGLGIPDPEDHEVRILISDQAAETTMALSFTVGLMNIATSNPRPSSPQKN